jgi:hypothetical protein
MKHLLNPCLGQPTTGDLVAILVSLQADGSEGARALSDVMVNLPVGPPLNSEVCWSLGRAAYDWMAATLSADVA